MRTALAALAFAALSPLGRGLGSASPPLGGGLSAQAARDSTRSGRETVWSAVPPPLSDSSDGGTVAGEVGEALDAKAGDGEEEAPLAPDAPGLLRDTLPGMLVTRPLAGGGRVAVYGEPESSLVAIRIAFPLSRDFGPPEALARMAQTLAGEELELGAAAYGAQTRMDRSATHASFAILGAAEDAPALAAVLRRAITWGNWDESRVRTARLIAESRGLQDRETPEPLLRHRLAAALFPDLSAGADSVPPVVRAATLHGFWAASFRPERMQAVMVGRITDAQAGALLGSWPVPHAPADARAAAAEDARESAMADAQDAPAAPPRQPAVRPQDAPATPRQPGVRGQPQPARKRPGRTTRPTTPPATASTPMEEARPSRGVPQVLSPWAAVGWPISTDPATAAVAARLVQAHLPDGMLRLARAELWWTGERRALVLLGAAAAPQVTGATPLSALEATVGEAASNVTADEVATAHLDVAREILLAGRTPQGLAEFLGQLFERTGDPGAGQLFLRLLERVNRVAVEQALKRLGTGAAAEVRP